MMSTLDDSIILTSILAEPGRVDRDHDMIGYNAEIKINGETHKVDSWQLQPIACPFSIIDEFDRWFEWWRRVEFEGESRLMVTADMLGIINAINRRIKDRVISGVFKAERGYHQAVGFLNQVEADLTSGDLFGVPASMLADDSGGNRAQAEANERRFQEMLSTRQPPAIVVRGWQSRERPTDCGDDPRGDALKYVANERFGDHKPIPGSILGGYHFFENEPGRPIDGDQEQHGQDDECP